jgi:6,7-dimethyl-8-ribityllumazine synthase
MMGSGGSVVKLDATAMRIGVVSARFNEAICSRITTSCVAQLIELGVKSADIEQLSVPGALEIPSALQALAEAGRCDALIAIGTVIRGETYHFEIVSDQSAAGVQRVALDYRLPIANAILTTANEQQALARAAEKGAEAARVAVEMCALLRHYK